VWVSKSLSLIMQVLFALTDLPRLPAWLSYRIPAPPSWVAWGFAISIFAAACTLPRSRLAFRTSLAALACLGLLISLHPFPPRVSSGVLEVTVLDCGPGEALLAVLPDRSTMLINTGTSRAARFDPAEGIFERRRWDPSEDIVSPYLWSRGLKAIDIIVLTRASQASGLAAIVDNFRIGEIWYVRAPGENAPSARSGLPLILGKARQRGTVLRQIAAQDAFSRGGASIWVLRLSPSAEGGRATDDPLMLRISASSPASMRQTERAGPGDSSNAASLDRNRLLPEPSLLLGFYETSHVSLPPYLARIVPGLAVVQGESSAGIRLQGTRLPPQQDALAQVFRTEHDGAVTVQISGDRLRIRCYAHPCGR